MANSGWMAFTEPTDRSTSASTAFPHLIHKTPRLGIIPRISLAGRGVSTLPAPLLPTPQICILLPLPSRKHRSPYVLIQRPEPANAHDQPAHQEARRAL